MAVAKTVYVPVPVLRVLSLKLTLNTPEVLVTPVRVEVLPFAPVILTLTDALETAAPFWSLTVTVTTILVHY